MTLIRLRLKSRASRAKEIGNVLVPVKILIWREGLTLISGYIRQDNSKIKFLMRKLGTKAAARVFYFISTDFPKLLTFQFLTLTIYGDSSTAAAVLYSVDAFFLFFFSFLIFPNLRNFPNFLYLVVECAFCFVLTTRICWKNCSNVLAEIPKLCLLLGHWSAVLSLKKSLFLISAFFLA